MKGLWLEDKQLRYREDLPMPELDEGEVLIKTNMAGICATDLEMVKGYYPFTGVLGHEFVGTVVESPLDKSLVGRRVVGDINIVCGACSACRAGRKTHCEDRRTLGIANYNGVFAEYFKLPAQNLFLVPDSVPNERAVFTELLAAALQIQKQIHIKPTDKVYVLGAGRLGLLIAQCLKLLACQLTVIVRRLEPTKMLNAWGVPWAFAEDLQDSSADMVVEVTGSKAGFALAQRLVRPAGKIILKSTFAGNLDVNLSKLVVDEIELIGSRCGPMDAALRLLGSDLIQTDCMINGTYPIEKGLEAFEAAAQPGVLKVLLRF